MKIFFVCYDPPSPIEAGSLRVLNSIKYLAEKHHHDITIVAFSLPGLDYGDLSKYCHVETVDIARRPGFESPRAIFSALGQMLHPRNVFSRYPTFANLPYSTKMAQMVKRLINKNEFDIMLLDTPQMMCYMNKKIPAVLLETFAISEMAKDMYLQEKNWLKKIIRLLYFYQTKNYAEAYRNLNARVAVSEQQRKMVQTHCPDLDITVIPTGIDTGYLHAVENEAESPNLIITGTMYGLRNENTVLAFYDNIFPLIKASIPNVKLYIVGKNPGERIVNLSKDKAVIVTGFVEDLRPYLSRAWVVVAPLQEGFGMKIRVLQAMAVGKAVVATSPVGDGISVTPGENIVLADSYQDFADRVVELLLDKELRQKIGNRARELMLDLYNWEKLTDQLNEVFVKTARIQK